jgi:hypothetical protein
VADGIGGGDHGDGERHLTATARDRSGPAARWRAASSSCSAHRDVTAWPNAATPAVARIFEPRAVRASTPLIAHVADAAAAERLPFDDGRALAKPSGRAPDAGRAVAPGAP